MKMTILQDIYCDLKYDTFSLATLPDVAMQHQKLFLLLSLISGVLYFFLWLRINYSLL